MTLHILEELTQWDNLAESYISFIKQVVCKDLAESDALLVLWDYYVERRVRINSLTIRNLFQLDERNPHLTVHDAEGDISNLCDYKSY